VNRFSRVLRLPEFERDFKSLLRKFKSLEDDFKVFQAAQIVPYHKLGVDNGGIVRITGLGFEVPQIYKARKFACRCLKGRGVQSGIRVIYAYEPDNNYLTFIEIYFKADQANENQKRILAHYGR
jgi:mRNA-degrading endonuclease RelE of RelBE toxin-antitoxin system